MQFVPLENDPTVAGVITGKFTTEPSPEGFQVLKDAMATKSFWAEFSGEKYIFTELDAEANFKLELLRP